MRLVRAGRIPTIDGLRGIAILLVVWFHIWQISWLPTVIPGIHLSLQPFAETGFVGVALFFFISGFVLLLPYAEAHEGAKSPPTLRHFIDRRVRKIVPSYVLCIIVLIAIGYQTYPNLPAAIEDVVFHLLFIHDWFAATSASINGVMWSLGVEVQFYVLFPLFVGQFVRRPVVLTLAFFAIANAWRIWTAFAPHYFWGQRLEALPAFFDVFAAGMFAAWLFVRITSRHPALAERRALFSAIMLAGGAAFLALVVQCFNVRYDADWPQIWNVAWRSPLAIAFAATALGSLFAWRWLRALLGNPALLFLAAISYNLYLWHQPLARMLLAHHIPPFAGADHHADPNWPLPFSIIATAASLALAWLITFAFEQPLLRSRFRLASARAADRSSTA